MRAYELQDGFGIDHLREVARPDPEIPPGHVAIRLHAASLNFRDLLVVRGVYNPRMKLPRVPLSDGAGEVVAIGEGVTQRRLGDRVILPFFPAWKDGELSKSKSASALGGDVDGVLQELVVVPEGVPVVIPSYLDFIQAATLPCAAVTAWNGLYEAGSLLPGQTVLLIGTGGVSLFGLQLAKAAGARVVLLSRSKEKLKRGLELGADHGINVSDTPDWEKAVLQLTGGEGVDVTLEVAGAGTLNRTLKATQIGGRVSLIGVVAGRVGEVDVALILHKTIKITGIYVGSQAMLTRLTRALDLHQIVPQVDRVFRWREVKEGLKHLEAGAHFGKLVIDFEPRGRN